MKLRRRKTIINNLVYILLGTILLSQSAIDPGNSLERVRAFTRMIEFDFISWTIDALNTKTIQTAISVPEYLDIEGQRNVVFEYLNLVSWINRTSAEADRIYANPDIADPDKEAAEINERLQILKSMEKRLKPIAESMIQAQVSATINEMDLAFGGQPIPPVLYHVSSLPDALIISPRNVIRQDQNISLDPDINKPEITQLEKNVEQELNVSALVVPVGGIGTYPTMVMSTTDLNWLVEVVAHEWTHNFLTLRPLGIRYMENEQMRTINETTANLAGKEIGAAVIQRYYPELAPEPQPALDESTPTTTTEPEDPNKFDYTREMHKTRVHADGLLAEGKIEEAEEYMEARRVFFWENGYQIRRLNQAYFAFYGAYNDVPGGGAAGQDPVGPTVQELRKYSDSLADFLNRISWVSSFDELQQALQTAREKSGSKP